MGHAAHPDRVERILHRGSGKRPCSNQLYQDRGGGLPKDRLQAGQVLLSGDNSGTHKKELAIWKKANIEPKGIGIRFQADS